MSCSCERPIFPEVRARYSQYCEYRTAGTIEGSVHICTCTIHVSILELPCLAPFLPLAKPCALAPLGGIDVLDGGNGSFALLAPSLRFGATPARSPLGSPICFQEMQEA